MPPTSSNSVAQARLREALNAGGPGTKEKGPPVADGFLSVTPDTPEAIEFRSRQSVIDSIGASSSGYLEDEAGPKPSELYGKFTWKIENFSEIGKRELRSTIFEVGSYKWYILVYPQGCDVCNHLSLFLCVADYDKLLPGWSHFAQFTIAVVNKDPKKSKYSDTLHRFCKKEHDWGWKKFMELNKVLEGFTVNNTLVIKAQVQVIRDRLNVPFRCLDAQYRRELVRVYLTNVETICRKFVDEKRESLALLREDSKGFRQFLASLDPSRKRLLASEKGEVVMKAVVKRFFNEKEVTSTLVMDALFSGCKQLEEAGRTAEAKKGKRERPGAVIHADKHIFSLTGDFGALLDRAATESIPPFRDDKSSDQLTHRNAQDADDYSRDYVERDERRLADLGRRAVEMFAIFHIFNELQAAHSEAESIKLQDALIREEEEAERLEDQRQASRLAAERERKARKKERRRAKKVAEEAQEAERRKDEADEAQESPSENRSKQRKETSPSTAAAGASQQKTVPAPPAPGSSTNPSTATGSISDFAAARTLKAETTGRPSSMEDEATAARQAQATARSSNEASDDESSATSRSGSEDKPTVSKQQFEDHIEYLKGELARAVSQLNSVRSELVSSGESLASAQAEIEHLKSEIVAAKAELANKSLQLRDARPAPQLAAQSVASSLSAVNLAEDASLVSSMDNDNTSQTGSLEPGADGILARNSGPQEGSEAGASGEANGSLSHNRKPMWNGAHGPAYQEGHPTTAAHLLQQHPHLLNARSKSGQLSGIRQPPPPPPPPADHRGGATPRASTMSRQGSAPQPKDGHSSARQQPNRSQPQQAQQGWSGNGGHNNQRRAEAQSGHRQAAKAKAPLNGNAPSFVPVSGTGTQPNGGISNGIHPISYRNVAAGLMSSQSSDHTDQSSLSASLGKGSKEPKPVATGKGRNTSLSSGSVPATPRSGDMGSAPAASSVEESQSPTHLPVKAQTHPQDPFSPQVALKKAEGNGPAESPGLDDFAHMGLITDLLE